MIQSVNQIIQRISDIERRFVKPAYNVSNSEFSTTLASAIAKQQGNETTSKAISKNAGRDNIAKMVHLAAVKYGIDPKLALAVAQAESGLSPEAVSPVGAVGVMQLMPDTARSLGVNNSHDPQENIDGGVRYLKQMMTQFNGNVTHAVAAYNAGPQAVKNYNGVPPYSETRTYVTRVLSMAK